MSLIFIGKEAVENGKSELSKKSAGKMIEANAVTEIMFNGGSFSDAEFQSLTDLLQCHEAVHSLSLVFLDPPLSAGPNFLSLTHIRSLDLGNSLLHAGAGDSLSKLIAAGTLKELWLQNTGCNNRVLDSLNSGLQHDACTLNLLSLEGNPLNDSSLRRLFEALKKNKSLTSLFLLNQLGCSSSIPVLVDVVSQVGVLKQLSVAVTGLKPLKQLLAVVVPNLTVMLLQIDKKTKLAGPFIQDTEKAVKAQEKIRYFSLSVSGSDAVPIYFIKM